MNPLKKVSARFRAFFSRAKLDDEMAEEMRQHLDRRTQANIAAGMPPEEARYAAQRQFGGVDQLKEIAREQRGWAWAENCSRDIRFAARSLVKTPGFSVVAMLIVTLGIGSATVMFSMVNALVLRPLALPEPERLVAIYETNLPRNVPFFSVSLPNYVDWRNRAQSWEGIAALMWHTMNLTGNGEPGVVQVKEVTANFFPTLGIPIVRGRNFFEEEGKPGAAKVAIISEACWKRRFGGSGDIVGRVLHFDGEPYTVVGVSAPGQVLPGDLDVVVPLLVAPGPADRRMNHELEVYGRLKHGVALEQAEAELKTIAAQISTEHPDMEDGWSTRLVPLAREIVGEDVRRSLYILLGAVGLLLVIACANLSNLLLTRASSRVQELAIRTALGASRGRIVRQIVTESLVLTLAGGALGIFISFWAVQLMRGLPLPRAAEISVDPRVLAAALFATLLAGLVSSLGPALTASQVRPQEALKGRSSRFGRHSAFRNTMVVAQLAISLTLLVSATLVGRSFLGLLRVNPGFSSENTVTISLRPENQERAAGFYEHVLERLTALPGVASAGVTSGLPLTGGNPSNTLFPVGESKLPAGGSIQAGWRLIAGDYFSALRIPLVKGRTFAGLPPSEAARSVIVSAALARTLFGDADPVGRQIDSVRAGGDRLTVIGVVGDVRSQKLGSEPEPMFYWSMHRFIYGPMHLVVRGHVDAVSLLPAIRAAIQEVDPAVPIFRIRTLEQLRATSLDQERLLLALLGGFTVAALLLAALGTYGVTAFNVQQRTREIGVRIAIGAQTGDILGLILNQGARLLACGIVLGSAGALASARIISALLYGTEATDPLSYLLSIAVLGMVTVAAALFPALRAAKVDPMTALRAE